MYKEAVAPNAHVTNRTSVQTALSKLPSANGKDSATPFTRVRLLTLCCAALARAYGHISWFGSTAVTAISYRQHQWDDLQSTLSECISCQDAQWQKVVNDLKVLCIRQRASTNIQNAE